METGCRYFSGYKPCGRNETCDSFCPSRDIPKNRILVVHLEALGAVLRGTSLLPAIKRKFPSSHITWVTQKPAHDLLKNNSLIDRLLTTERDDLLTLSALEFDFGFVVDKSLKAMGVLSQTQCDMIYGFIHNSQSGAILPATAAAQELWEIGLNDNKKFFENKKTETQLLAESLELQYQRDNYILNLTQDEQERALERRNIWSSSREHKAPLIIGMNTGCSPTIVAKKLTVKMHQKIITRLMSEFGSQISIVLLGGREDTQRNQEIAADLSIHESPTELGLRDGIVSVAACDMIITGDSLGMHIGIALEKYVAAWFGPTCAHEIDLYDRGTTIYTQADCSPCWKRTCQKTTMCYDLVRVEDFVAAVLKGLDWHKKSSLFKPPFSEISS